MKLGSAIVTKLIKEIARSLGFEVARYRPSSSPQSQINKIFENEKINLIFDIGANEGQFASQARSNGYQGKIVSFEPLSSASQKLHALANRDKDWIVHRRCAIGDHDGEIEINIAGNSVSSSILPMLKSHANAAVDSAYVSSEKVPIFCLDSIAHHYLEPSSNLFIKIDTQGYEWQVLDGACEILKQARGVLCELSLVPLYDGQRLWRDIIDRLESEGFMLWALQKGFTDPRTGQSLQMDGIFLRRE
jgi:FkbM family methyltransferase